jgi:hypothetical protein
VKKNLQIKSFMLKELNPAKYNPKTITDEALNGLGNSLKRFGYVDPIIVNVRDEKNVIVGGHQRYKALLKLHKPDYKIDCIIVDLDEKEEKLLNITLNNPNIQGQFNKNLESMIKGIISSLPEDDTSIIDLRIDQLSKEISQNQQDEDVDCPEVEFTQELREENNYLVFVFDDFLDWQVAKDIFGLKTVQALDSKEGYEKKGIGRVLSGRKLLEVCGVGK